MFLARARPDNGLRAGLTSPHDVTPASDVSCHQVVTTHHVHPDMDIEIIGQKEAVGLKIEIQKAALSLNDCVMTSTAIYVKKGV